MGTSEQSQFVCWGESSLKSLTTTARSSQDAAQWYVCSYGHINVDSAVAGEQYATRVFVAARDGSSFDAFDIKLRGTVKQVLSTKPKYKK